MSQTTHTVPFEKYHGTGNDFVIVDAADEPVPDRVAFARAYCDREQGVSEADTTDSDAPAARTGADGVLFLTTRDASEEELPRVRMKLVQPDGSVAAMCGNGARCAAAWAADRLGVDELVVDTDAGPRHATIRTDGVVAIEMGIPSFAPSDVPLDGDSPLVETAVEGLTITAVNTGVPHAVAFVEDVDAVDLEAVAPAVRHADVFPEGANVNLAAHDGEGFAQRTFERGVEGETRSCGTGAVAIAAAAKHTGRVGDGGPPSVQDADPVRVRPPGGELEITVPDDGPATLTGPVEREFGGELLADPDSQHA